MCRMTLLLGPLSSGPSLGTGRHVGSKLKGSITFSSILLINIFFIILSIQVNVPILHKALKLIIEKFFNVSTKTQSKDYSE